MNRRTALARIASTVSMGLLGSFSFINKSEAANWTKLKTSSGVTERGVYGWGNGSNGQLGNNFAGGCKSVPTMIDGLGNVSAVAGGGSGFHALFLLSSGCIVGMGYNYTGQLGNGTITNSSTPVAVCGITTAIAVSRGSFHALALLASGSVMSWGTNDSGQLGNNATGCCLCIPTTVCGLSNVSAIAAGSDFSVALLSDGTVKAWGLGSTGQLGNNTVTAAQKTPVTVCTLSGVASIAAGSTHTLALLANGCIRSWGSNFRGQLGDNTVTCRSTPVTVCGITNAIAIAAGGSNSYALLSDGTIRGWGYAFVGDGTASTTDKSSPVAVCGISNAVSVAAGGSSFGLALLADGTMMAWGRNMEGELGNNSTTSTCTPVFVCGVTSSLGSVARAKSQKRLPIMTATSDSMYFLNLG